LTGNSASEGEFNFPVQFNHKEDEVDAGPTITIDVTAVTDIEVSGQIE